MTPATNQQQAPIDFDRLMTLPEVGRLLRVSKWTVYELINKGTLTTVSIGRRRLVTPRDYLDLVDKLRGGHDHGR